ncbi:signal peptidase II [Chelatococcus asaccharovorans]|uniref:Lipoprotein signal peptidase n=1 Tax=Chelatococcus asaccharovorans TaxID=28210 RepID=A0A2V3UDN6_9HYPH|nr:signal peptidase II [Chelatococcus asaccharovorans]MBS7702239.1 signal peptidase II [Chelatococcus asaccharovorans]PXW56562.1 signal peptidase II [Chelatococcus asaccharovorans]
MSLSPARLGAVLSILTFVVDQATKLWLYYVVDIGARPPIAVTPFFDLMLVWNRGVSYGLFQQEGPVGPWVLVILSLAAAVGLGIWLSRVNSRLMAVAIGLIIGGALGNAVDRAAYGAVLDFAHLHAFGYSWYVFNIADAAIVAGVIGILYDALFLEHRRAKSS